ncbi:hypothetical protein ABZU32_30380 [Sphaerisporangium sp. NPDC005288]|uniref:hypothetical protein n=1 Tax=Sphaerisporangium sp. NPDC005288 TaxID=3155114 RepID=UPI0033BAD577
MHKPVGRSPSNPAITWEVSPVKQILIPTCATPWLASPRGSGMRGAAPVMGAARFTAPVAMPAAVLTVAGPAKLRQEKTARILADAAGFAYGTTVVIAEHAAALGRPFGDEQTSSTANGGVQGPPPWRHPVIT